MKKKVLAALLRAGISGSEHITLEDELELIQRYLDIQEIRFGDRFVCELDVDERFQYCIVPKLVLQPLVENAIIHGVADSDEGFIKLWAEEDNGDMLLYVSDNGPGIPRNHPRKPPGAEQHRPYHSPVLRSGLRLDRPGDGRRQPGLSAPAHGEGRTPCLKF